MAVKFDTNIPLTLYFPYGDAKPKEGKYGVQMMYTTGRSDTDRDYLYASDTLHAILGRLPLKGQSATITKKEKSGKSYWEVQFGAATFSSLDADPTPTPPTDTNSLDAAFPISTPSSSMAPRADVNISMADLTLCLKECLEGAEWAWTEAMINFRNPVNPTSEDIRALAVTLFIQSRR